MSEEQLYPLVERYLVTQARYENIGTKRLYNGHTPDLLFKFGPYLVAVEVKMSSEGTLNALSVAYSLVKSPDVNAAIVVVPEGKTTGDISALADQTGLGLATINLENGRWSWLRQPNFLTPAFSQQWNYPREVTAGQEFAVTVTISNGGQKMLADVTVSYVQAYPFMVPQGKTNSARVPEIGQSGSATSTLSVTTANDSAKGSYPLLIKVEMLGATPTYGTMEIRVR